MVGIELISIPVGNNLLRTFQLRDKIMALQQLVLHEGTKELTGFLSRALLAYMRRSSSWPLGTHITLRIGDVGLPHSQRHQGGSNAFRGGPWERVVLLPKKMPPRFLASSKSMVYCGNCISSVSSRKSCYGSEAGSPRNS